MLKDKSDIDFKVGETYPFTVNTIHKDFCELLDESGFQVYLQHTSGLMLNKHQRIRCIVTAYTQRRPRIELVNAKNYEAGATKLTTRDVEQMARATYKGWDAHAFTSLLMMSEVEDRTFENECREWIQKLEAGGESLDNARAACIRFMEESDFLTRCTSEERETYQRRLTQMIDLLGYYIDADRLIDEGEAAHFIGDLFGKLEKTGVVYQPEKKFNILSCLFLADHSLVEANIERLFTIIRQWPLDVWIKEPFRGTLVKVLTLYLSGNIWNVDREADNTKLVRNLMQGLAILYLLTKDGDDRDTTLPDERLTVARMCVLSTYNSDYNNRQVMDVALNALAGRQYCRPAFDLLDIEGQKVQLMLKTYQPPAGTQQWPVDTTSMFISGRRRLVIDPKEIAIHSGEKKEKALLPQQLALWGNLQVYADKRFVSTSVGKPTIEASKRMWEDIERVLFESSLEPTAKEEKRTVAAPAKVMHSVGDTVTVVVTRVVPDDVEETKAMCRIEGEEGERAYFYGKDVVSYIHRVDPWMFLDDDDMPLRLEAKVKDEDPDGMYHVSMLDMIKDWVWEGHHYGDEVLCSLGKDRPAGAQRLNVPAITPDGECVSLGGVSDSVLHQGDVVRATVQGCGTGTFHISCNIVGPTDEEKVNPAIAFHKLLLDYALPEAEADPQDRQAVDDDSGNDEDFEQNDRLLDASYVKELVRLLDRMADIDAEYVKSYNYMAYARTLCRLIGWEAQADYYRVRMQIIVLLHDFAVNDHVDEGKLDSLKDTTPGLFSHNADMSEKYQQLRIVSYLGSDQHSDELWAARNSASQETTRRVADLVLAYNILKEAGMDTQANDVRNSVKTTLKLKGYESNLKAYGPGYETKTVEYKSTIVFPPDNQMQPDINVQLNNILAVIASFLNTDGGTLYIGCNNSGAGIGLDNDLKYSEFNGDRDKYLLRVINAVNLQWKNYVGTFVSATWDHSEKSGKDVLVVSVKPYAKGVDLDGVWYYRDDVGKRKLSKEEFDKYNERRLKDQPAAASVPAAGNAEPAAPVATGTAETKKAKTVATPSGDLVKTSVKRKNILEDYGNNDYRPYIGCLQFLPNGKLRKTDTYYFDNTEGLNLAVYEEEEKAYLVLGYADGSVTKVPMDELLAFDDYSEYAIYSGAKLQFATIAQPDDAIISVTREDKTRGRAMVRVDDLKDIPEGRLSDKGTRLYNVGLASEVLAYGIVLADDKDNVKTLMDRDTKTLGFPLASTKASVKRALAKSGIEI